MVETQMLRIKKILQDLLLLSHADASSLKVHNEEIYFDDLVAEASRAARALAVEKQQELTLQSLPEARIIGDADLLGQAVMILLDNAVKFTPAGGTIEVGIHRSGVHWVCYVTDNGLVIPEDERANVFNRFYRATNDAGSGKEPGGSGLGLAIATVIVESHRGSLILAESRPGVTRFEIRLLAVDGEDQVAKRNQAKSLSVKT
jgi:two-component system sensor histidine kinase CiaH